MVNDALDPTRPATDYIDHFFALATVDADSVRAYIADHMPVDAHVEVTVVPRG